jgi:fructose-1-phosphate kinase PfkB-like protein
MTPADFSALIDSPIAAGARVAVDTTGAARRALAGKRRWRLKPNAAELAELVGRPIADLQALEQRNHAGSQDEADEERGQRRHRGPEGRAPGPGHRG